MTEPQPPSGPARLWRTLISPRLTVICLALMFILTFWGTVYQVEHGLHEAKLRFFDSWIVMTGVFPFPGTQLVVAVLLVNLLGYLGQKLARDKLHAGMLLTHGGVLLLLLGGAITQRFGEESHLSLVEGEAANVSTSYSQWEVALWSTDLGVRDVRAVDAGPLRAGDSFAFPESGLQVEVEAIHANCRAFLDPVPEAPESSRGITHLEAAPREREPERNRAGAVLQVTAPGLGSRRIVLFGEDSFSGLRVGGKTYELALRHVRHPLPLLVTLLDFQREVHPGTEMARSFSSKIEVAGDGARRTLTVSMNKPFRERGLTFYQASYGQGEGGAELSTFAVTRNYGRLIPYVATGIVTLGMLVHFAAALARRARRSRP